MSGQMARAASARIVSAHVSDAGREGAMAVGAVDADVAARQRETSRSVVEASLLETHVETMTA
jgi:hypothetical protein